MQTRTRFILAGMGGMLLLLAGAVVGQDAPNKQPADPPEQNQPDAEPSDGTAKDADSPATPTTPPAGEVRTSTPPSADDVLKAFEDERPRVEPLKPVTDETAPPLGVVENDPGRGADRARMPEGYLLVDRTGRLSQQGPWWQLVFVADNNPETAPQPPIKLLPNQMLERMIRETQSGARDVEFVVSGEVTDFMGENYLLLRKLMRKRDMGNLSK